MFFKSANMPEEVKLHDEKLDLKVRLLGWLEELKKALDDIMGSQEKIASNQLEIARLRTR